MQPEDFLTYILPGLGAALAFALALSGRGRWGLALLLAPALLVALAFAYGKTRPGFEGQVLMMLSAAFFYTGVGAALGLIFGYLLGRRGRNG